MHYLFAMLTSASRISQEVALQASVNVSCLQLDIGRFMHDLASPAPASRHLPPHCWPVVACLLQQRRVPGLQAMMLLQVDAPKIVSPHLSDAFRTTLVEFESGLQDAAPVAAAFVKAELRRNQNLLPPRAVDLLRLVQQKAKISCQPSRPVTASAAGGAASSAAAAAAPPTTASEAASGGTGPRQEQSCATCLIRVHKI